MLFLHVFACVRVCTSLLCVCNKTLIKKHVEIVCIDRHFWHLCVIKLFVLLCAVCTRHHSSHNLLDLATGYTVDSAEALKIDLIERARKSSKWIPWKQQKRRIPPYSVDSDCFLTIYSMRWAIFCGHTFAIFDGCKICTYAKVEISKQRSYKLHPIIHTCGLWI